MKAIYLFVIIGILFVANGCKPSTEYPMSKNGEVSWIDINQASSLQNKDQKLYMIDVYTTWCRWCKVMDQKTFTDPEVIKELDARFHAVKFNAEQDGSVNWNGQEYIYQAGGRSGVHTLAIHLLEGRLSYPSIAVLDKDRNVVKIIVGYKEPQQLLQELKSING